MKKRIYELLEVSKRRGDLSWWFDAFLITLITLNIVAIILETIQPIQEAYSIYFHHFEIFSVAFFSIEYLLRIWTINENEKYRAPVTGNIKYAFTGLAIIDLLAVLPFYLPFFGLDLRFLRMLRLLRLFRLFKLARYVKALRIMGEVMKEKKEELIVSIIITLFLLLFASTIMYYVEHEAQPHQFKSIPDTMWWAIATLTTVGYGDIYPITGLGKLFGGIIALLGIGLFALPTGILASGFSEKLTHHTGPGKICPHCGKEID